MEWTDYLRFIAALGAVLALILILTWGLRRFGPKLIAGPMAAQRRLSIIEALQIDPKHRLVLVGRDGDQHLILLGGAQPVVVEVGIKKVGQGEAL